MFRLGRPRISVMHMRVLMVCRRLMVIVLMFLIVGMMMLILVCWRGVLRMVLKADHGNVFLVVGHLTSSARFTIR